MTAPAPAPPIVALMTDFGEEDEYVGVMKGAILRRAPHAVLVDLCHRIPPHDIRRAAEMIAAAYSFFPETTLFVMVVDPGVGSDRDILLARSGGRGFLCPDNGLLTRLLARGALDSARRVTNPQTFSATVSPTFHGRDIMAPVAGYLAAGGPPEALGPSQPLEELVRLAGSSARWEADGSLYGLVVTIDRFGNVVTDIDRDLLTSLCEGDLNGHLIVQAGVRRIIPLAPTYSARPPGELMALIGSRNTLEIAVNRGNAAQKMGVAAGTSIRVQMHAPS